MQYKNFILDGECKEPCVDIQDCNECVANMTMAANADDREKNVQRNLHELCKVTEKRMVSVFKIFVLKNIIKFHIKMYMKFEISVYFSLHN